MERDLTLREALAADCLDDFVRQEVAMGAELVNGSELERALALLITQHRRVPSGSAHAARQSCPKHPFEPQAS
jgi:hypothetical protein